MGCWNGTCGISNLPIRYGEKIVCFILRKEDYRETNKLKHECYPWDHASPLTFPLIGYYNDYGSIEKIEPSPHADFLVKFFQKNFSNLKYDKSYHGDKIETIDDVVSIVERGCSISDTDYGLYMVHYDIYMQLTNYSFNEEQKKFAEMSLYNTDQTKMIFREMNRIKNGEEKRYTDKDEEWFDSVKWERGYIRVGSLLHEQLYIRNIDEASFDEATRLTIFCNMLGVLRKSFYSGSGAGGQDDEYEHYIEAYMIFCNFAKVKLKE